MELVIFKLKAEESTLLLHITEASVANLIQHNDYPE
jgi:hypothetical protein